VPRCAVGHTLLLDQIDLPRATLNCRRVRHPTGWGGAPSRAAGLAVVLASYLGHTYGGTSSPVPSPRIYGAGSQCTASQIGPLSIGEPQGAITPNGEPDWCSLRRGDGVLGEDARGRDAPESVGAPFSEPEVAVRPHHYPLWEAARAWERKLGDDTAGSNPAPPRYPPVTARPSRPAWAGDIR
jgi:hypothetical protein